MNKERLINEFIEMVKVPSESKSERDFALLLEKKLTALGFETMIDDSAEKTGSNTGNVLARLKGTTSAETVIFAAHMDTVSPGIGIDPIIDGDVIKSDGKTILGADDKSAIAAFLEAIRTIQEEGVAHGDIEVAFTTIEESGMYGAKNLDYSFLNGKTAFALDSGGKPGTVIVKAPAKKELRAHIKGRAAHAGVEPEKGISAIMVMADAISRMKLLRIDEDTTANIGRISGGTVTNIVAEHCDIVIEARSLIVEKLNLQVQHLVSCLEDSCTRFGAELTCEVESNYPPLNVPESSHALAIAKKAAEKAGFPFRATSTGGGSDANIFAGKGLDVVNLGIGMSNPHSVNEFIAIEDMVNTSKYIVEIIQTM
mgnify:CR=1 FL=1